MRTKRLVFVVYILVGLLLLNISGVTAQTEAANMQWDIVSVTVNEQGQFVLSAGAAGYARANDGSTIMVKGSGTFGSGMSDPVTGGGEWMTFDGEENPTGQGTFTVTGFATWEEAPGSLPPEAVVDNMGAVEDLRAGLAILHVAYNNEDGTSAGSGILIISCRLGGTPYTIFEGISATMGPVAFANPVAPVPGLDANHTAFHVLP